MTITSESELKLIRTATKLSTDILSQLIEPIRPGMPTSDIDNRFGELCVQNGVQAAFKGVPGPYNKFPANMCISINDEVLHGIAHPGTSLAEGDLLKLDFGIIYNGIYTDQCITVGVKSLSVEDEKLVKIARLAVQTGVTKAIVGNTTGDIGYAIYTPVQMAGYDVLKEFIGHGIGKSLHEDPEIPAYGQPGAGDALEDGQVLCVEAQVVAGTDEVSVMEDGWTVVTEDGKNGVMFEYMVIVRAGQPEILTQTLDWPLVI